jgi:hypothetical protein
VHILVVCSSCEFFKKSVTFAGKESSEKLIDLPEDDPEMIRRLVTYLYLGDYDPTNSWNLLKFAGIDQHGSTCTTSPTYHPRTGAYNFSMSEPCACLSPNLKKVEQLPGPLLQALPPSEVDQTGLRKTAEEVQVLSPLTIHAAMYALGDKYQVQGLSQIAKEKFESCLHHHANSSDFVSAVQVAYTSTPESNRGLRDAVLSAFRAHFGVDVAKIPGAEARLDAIDELSLHLIKSWPTKVDASKTADATTPRHSGVTMQPTGSLFGSPVPFGSSPLTPSTQPGGIPNLFGGSNSPTASQPRATPFGRSPART